MSLRMHARVSACVLHDLAAKWQKETAHCNDVTQSRTTINNGANKEKQINNNTYNN